MASSVLRFRSRFFGLPRSLRPDFSCLPSWFRYSAFCLFPFVPPGFAPTAVPPVLPFFSAFASLPGFSARLLLSFVCFCSLLTTQPSALSFPFFPFSPVGGSFGALRFLSSPLFSSSVRPVSMPSFRFWYSASCVSFRPFPVSPHSGYLQLSSF